MSSSVTGKAIDKLSPETYGVEVRRGVNLAPYTSMKVGGPAELFATVTTIEQTIKLARWARAMCSRPPRWTRCPSSWPVA